MSVTPSNIESSISFTDTDSTVSWYEEESQLLSPHLDLSAETVLINTALDDTILIEDYMPPRTPTIGERLALNGTLPFGTPVLFVTAPQPVYTLVPTDDSYDSEGDSVFESDLDYTRDNCMDISLEIGDCPMPNQWCNTLNRINTTNAEV